MTTLPMRLLALSLCFLGSLAVPRATFGEELPETNAALLRVHLPIVGNADQNLQTTLLRIRESLLEKARQNRDARRPLLFLQLAPPIANPDGGTKSQFERVLSLSRFLCSRKMSDVKTVAYVPRSIQGHGSLLAIACEEIVMAPDALLGEAGIHEKDGGEILETVVSAYREIAETRRTIPVALAVGMIDDSTEVLQVETEDGIDFVLRRDFEEFAENRVVIDEKVLVTRGTFAQFEGREGRQFGFVKYLATNRQALAKSYAIPESSLKEEELLQGDWVPVMIDVSGEITTKMVSQIETMVGTELERGETNWVGVRIGSSGGKDISAGVRLASFFASLDPNSVRTVAYVPAEAAGGAAVVAMSCHQLVIHPEAKLKTRSVPPKDRAERLEADLDAARATLQDSLAPLLEKNWSLLMAMLDPSVELFQYQNKVTGATVIMSPQEASMREDADDWQRRKPLQEGQEPLALSGDQAAELSIASETVDSFDSLKQLYGFENDPRELKPNWALELVGALASPGFAMILIMVSLFGVYFELRAPGIGIGGFIAALGFLLFFWSMYLNGTAGWLEVVLLLGGICFILLEVFVIPGFGIFGLGGAAMVLASLILASLTFVWPQSEGELEQLTWSVGSVSIACVGVLSMILFSRRYLPYTPFLSNFVLEPPVAEEQAVLHDRETMVDYTDLVGKRGTATTHLRPTGKAEIDHELVDVIAESEPLDRGTPLVVVDAQANRVVVRGAGPA